MDMEDLNGKYHHLRHELDEAYSAPVWDSQRIDRITEEMAPIEKALATLTVRSAAAATDSQA